MIFSFADPKVPAKQISWPPALSSDATFKAGKMCPPVPPVAIIIFMLNFKNPVDVNHEYTRIRLLLTRIITDPSFNLSMQQFNKKYIRRMYVKKKDNFVFIRM